MKITHEILAAYADGTLPESMLPEVRQYLAVHPEELDHVVKLMDSSHEEECETLSQATLNPILGASAMVSGTLLAASGAAFMIARPFKEKRAAVRKVDIQSNLTNLLNELI